MANNIRRSIESRRGTVERSRAVAGGVYTVDGIIDLTGTGELTVDVLFPVTFTEMPILVGGGGVAPNQRILPNEFPTWSVGVRDWNLGIDPDFPDMPTFKGATLIIIVTGATADSTTFQSRAFWTARGRALTNPTVSAL